MSAPNQQPPSETMPSKGSSSHTGAAVAVAVIVTAIVVFGAIYGLGYFHKAPATVTPVGACPAFTIEGAGSTFVAGLMTAWTTGSTAYPTNTVDYDAVGSGTGISDITTGTVDYGASDAPLNATQIAAAPNLLTMPETAGAVAVIFNLPVSFHVGDSLNLTGNVLAGIYLGTITTWNAPAIAALNPGVTLPSNGIAVYHRSDGSGTSYAFTQFLSADNATWKSTVSYGTLPDWPATPLGGGEKGSSGIAGTVKETPYAIGYVDLGYATENVISFAAIENPSSANIIPTVSDAASAIKDILATTTLPAGSASWADVSMINAPGAGDYPITTFSYLLYYQESTNNPLIKAGGLGAAEAFKNFLNWTINQGQADSGELYYVPLPTSVVAADEVTLATMTYNGGAIASCS